MVGAARVARVTTFYAAVKLAGATGGAVAVHCTFQAGSRAKLTDEIACAIGIACAK